MICGEKHWRFWGFCRFWCIGRDVIGPDSHPADAGSPSFVDTTNIFVIATNNFSTHQIYFFSHLLIESLYQILALSTQQTCIFWHLTKCSHLNFCSNMDLANTTKIFAVWINIKLWCVFSSTTSKLFIPNKLSVNPKRLLCFSQLCSK